MSLPEPKYKIGDVVYTSVAAAEPGDTYEDSAGYRWNVVGVFHKPTVVMEFIGDTDNRKVGAMSAPIWDGFKLIKKAKS